jgi:transcriptional regulator with XRE-family HTH domain
MDTATEKTKRNRRHHQNPWHFLKAALKAAGKNQKQLASDCRICQTPVGAWERGERPPNYRKLPLLADALGIPLEVLAAETAKHFGNRYL